MIKSNLYRTNKKHNRYLKELKKGGSQSCPFCVMNDRKILQDSGNFLVVDNLYEYDFWDGAEVEQHLMIIPKRHISKIADMTNDEKIEYVELLAKYNSDRYLLYTRYGGSVSGSQPHLHTHLIKQGKPKGKIVIFVKNIGLRIVK